MATCITARAARIFDIRRLKATRGDDEVQTHRHDDAHFVFVLSGTYISSALHAQWAHGAKLGDGGFGRQ